ncbi:MAG: phenylalanine--tRNA ligase subunit alpha [Tissierellia bacterium]|jgi:phenylalanyl-tRNA synthetase alpha chain|nr:phenylalanine--tRNA ligase subunit alpha [Tissierellia bacterium]
MKEQIENIKNEFLEEISTINEVESLEKLRVKYLGKKGLMTIALKGMGKLSNEERPVIGKLANEVGNLLKDEINNKKESLSTGLLKQKLAREIIDISLEKDIIRVGNDHPLMKTMEELEDLFVSLGFRIIPGPEIESVANNFDYLNSPEDHPSRDLSDTFYIDEKNLLRTHTSPVQIRSMKKYGAPIKMVSAGRTFRFDDVDDTHSPMFHQMEGLVVDENISMGDLIGTLDIFIKEFFGEDIETRYRPHYFPFTEPSVEVDVTCFSCHGAGCSACGGTGWSMELLGGGMVHPQVLENCGIDSEKYTGFAFGLGVDRVTMVKHGITNIRLLFENDNRFLNQF